MTDEQHKEDLEPATVPDVCTECGMVCYFEVDFARVCARCVDLKGFRDALADTTGELESLKARVEKVRKIATEWAESKPRDEEAAAATQNSGDMMDAACENAYIAAGKHILEALKGP